MTQDVDSFPEATEDAKIIADAIIRKFVGTEEQTNSFKEFIIRTVDPWLARRDDRIKGLQRWLCNVTCPHCQRPPIWWSRV